MATKRLVPKTGVYNVDRGDVVIPTSRVKKPLPMARMKKPKGMKRMKRMKSSRR